jgi:hypothetical protein
MFHKVIIIHFFHLFPWILCFCLSINAAIPNRQQRKISNQEIQNSQDISPSSRNADENTLKFTLIKIIIVLIFFYYICRYPCILIHEFGHFLFLSLSDISIIGFSFELTHACILFNEYELQDCCNLNKILILSGGFIFNILFSSVLYIAIKLVQNRKRILLVFQGFFIVSMIQIFDYLSLDWFNPPVIENLGLLSDFEKLDMISPKIGFFWKLIGCLQATIGIIYLISSNFLKSFFDRTLE